MRGNMGWVQLRGDGQVFDGFIETAALLYNFIAQSISTMNPFGFLATICRNASMSIMQCSLVVAPL